MKTYYICSKEVLQQYWNTHFKWHGTELPDGRMIIVIEAINARMEDEWSQHPEVEALPHPLSGEHVSSEHANVLKHLGVTPNHTMHDVSKHLAKINPMMAL